MSLITLYILTIAYIKRKNLKYETQPTDKNENH